MYICSECHKVFSAPAWRSEDRTPYGGPSEPGFQEVYNACPYCGGIYSSAMECVRCESEYIPVNSEFPFCDKCQEELFNPFKSYLKDTYREDEYDFLYDKLDGLSYKDL